MFQLLKTKYLKQYLRDDRVANLLHFIGQNLKRFLKLCLYKLFCENKGDAFPCRIGWFIYCDLDKGTRKSISHDLSLLFSFLLQINLTDNGFTRRLSVCVSFSNCSDWTGGKSCEVECQLQKMLYTVLWNSLSDVCLQGLFRRLFAL